MGKIISIWSSTRKTGKTMFLFNLVTRLSKIVDKNVTMLVACANLSHGNLLNLFKISTNEMNMEDVVNFKIHPDNSFDMLKALAQRDNIYYLGTRKTNTAYANRHMKLFESVVTELRNTFDIVFFDTISGNDNSLTNMLMDKSDHVLNVILQDKELLDSYPFVTGKEIAFIANRYRNIYPNESELRSDYNLKNLYLFPECNILQEMKNKDRLGFYMQHDTEYNRSMEDIVRYLAVRLRLQMKEQQSDARAVRSLFGFLNKGGRA